MLPCPWASESKLSLIRPLKWGTVCPRTTTGSKNISRQSWNFEKKSVFSSKTNDFLNFQLWRLVFFDPVGVQRHNVPQIKGLIKPDWNQKRPRRDSTISLYHTLLKKRRFIGKRAIVRRLLSLAVCVVVSDLLKISVSVLSISWGGLD